jgi:hypothetical protein
MNYLKSDINQPKTSCTMIPGFFFLAIATAPISPVTILIQGHTSPLTFATFHDY